MRKIKHKKEVCGEYSCDQVSVYKHKDKNFAIHKRTTLSSGKVSYIVVPETWSPKWKDKQSHKTLSQAKKQIIKLTK